jgi:hypothetical protein
VLGVLSCHVAGTFLVSNGHIKVIVEIKYNTIFCFSGLVSAMRSNGPHCKSFVLGAGALLAIAILRNPPRFLFILLSCGGGLRCVVLH